MGSFSEGGSGSRSLCDGRVVSLVRIEGYSIRTGTAELRSKGIFVSTQLGLTRGVVTSWLADFLLVYCFTINVFFTHLWMFPRFWLWGRLQTYSSEQVRSDHPLVLLVVLVQLVESVTLIVNRKLVDAHEY